MTSTDASTEISARTMRAGTAYGAATREQRQRHAEPGHADDDRADDRPVAHPAGDEVADEARHAEDEEEESAPRMPAARSPR